VASCGGLSLHFLTHVAMRIRSSTDATVPTGPAGSAREGFTAGIGMVAVIPIALVVPPLAAMAVGPAICCALIARDVIRYRDHQSQMREARP
jgi:hypothetical protein